MNYTDQQIDEAAHELQRVIALCGGEPTECAYDYLRQILGKLPVQGEGTKGVPAGWKLVPIEPTDAMRRAGGHANSEWLNDNAPIGEGRYAMPMLSVWHDMLAASPPAPAETEAEQPSTRAIPAPAALHGEAIEAWAFAFIRDRALNPAVVIEIAQEAARWATERLRAAPPAEPTTAVPSALLRRLFDAREHADNQRWESNAWYALAQIVDGILDELAPFAAPTPTDSGEGQ